MSIIEDFDSIGLMLRQLETDKGKRAVTEPASEVTDQVRHEFYSASATRLRRKMLRDVRYG